MKISHETVTGLMAGASLVYTLYSGALVQKIMQAFKKWSTKLDALPPLAKQMTVGMISLVFVLIGQVLSVQIDPNTTLASVDATVVGSIVTALFAMIRHAAEKAAAKA